MNKSGVVGPAHLPEFSAPVAQGAEVDNLPLAQLITDSMPAPNNAQAVRGMNASRLGSF
jgi:hypothetical protein